MLTTNLNLTISKFVNSTKSKVWKFSFLYPFIITYNEGIKVTFDCLVHYPQIWQLKTNILLLYILFAREIILDIKILLLLQAECLCPPKMYPLKFNTQRMVLGAGAFWRWH